ncbi:MAG TPA: 2-C-methyl-D-erythritol 4-phosphate cytidylyltransferase, partial [Chthoniobacterales bacterium]
MLSAIIVAGGNSRRMGFDKTFALLAGKPVVAHTIAAFEATASVAEIIVVGREDRLQDLREVVAGERFQKVTRVISGGVHRQDSVLNGL